MKIGLFGDNFNKPASGGGFTLENEILNAISRFAPGSGHEFYLFTNQDIHLENIATLQPSLRHRIQGVFFKLEKILTVPKSLSSESFCMLIKECKIDMMFYLTPWNKFDIDIPFISMVWDLQHRLQPFFPEVSSHGEFKYRETRYRDILPQATYIITGTLAGKKEIREFYNIPEEHIVIMPHPTPDYSTTSEASEEIITKLKPFTKRKFLFYPAQFWPHKNHINLVEALHILNSREGEKYDLVLCGSDKGNLPHIRNHVKRLNLDNYVHYWGFISRKELVWFYKRAAALTYVSFFGPENLPPLEAFALGCPVVASTVSGSEEQLGDAAMLVDPRNPQEIADAVIRLEQDPKLRAEMIQKGKAAIAKKSSTQFSKTLFQLFNDFEKFRRNWN